MRLFELPADLPVPVDDGACDHLLGIAVPRLAFDSTIGPVDLAEFGESLGVLFVYPRTGRPERPVTAEWDAIPGARGCTPQARAFREHLPELAALGALVAGLSAQPLDEQIEFAQREQMPFPVLADPDRRLGDALHLPMFEFEELLLYKRVTLIFEAASIAKVFYPVFPTDRNAGDVVEWLERRAV